MEISARASLARSSARESASRSRSGRATLRTGFGRGAAPGWWSVGLRRRRGGGRRRLSAFTGLGNVYRAGGAVAPFGRRRVRRARLVGGGRGLRRVLF